MASANLRNTQTSVNQILTVGNPSPTSMASVPERTLVAASPAGMNLAATTGVNMDAENRAAAYCRTFKGIDGLRRLQAVQSQSTTFEPGCGWRYQESSGLYPAINQAALGTVNGPTQKSVDAGGRWYWNLNDAERDISARQCQTISRCKQLAYMGDFANVCGFCKTSKVGIPIAREGGEVKARYPNDPSLGCKKADIVSSPGQCPPGVEGFMDLSDLDACSVPPLTRDCVLQAARTAGCKDSGALMTALGAGVGEGDYGEALRQNQSFQTYQKKANPNLTSAMLADGSVSMTTALEDFGRLVGDTQSPDEMIRSSARDLCIGTPEGFTNFNFCNEMTEGTVINAGNLVCAQNFWRNEGGTERGTLYPQIGAWNGKRFSELLALIRDLKGAIQSPNKALNADGLLKFVGVASDNTQQVQKLPRNENTRGVETVWIFTGDHGWAGIEPVIIRSDINLAKDGQVIPQILSQFDITPKYRVPQDNIAFIASFEARPDVQKNLQFQVTTDDGMMIGYNQNPFENFRGGDWGSWSYQGATTYKSGVYPIAAESQNTQNVFVVKWFQGGGGAVFDMPVIVNGQYTNMNRTFKEREDYYLTQEPLAPWLQYEVCNRPNMGMGATMGLFEKRFNGPSQFGYFNKKPMPSFDVRTGGGLVIQTDPQLRKSVPGEKGYASFTSGTSWSMLSRLNFTACKTFTILFRPMASGNTDQYQVILSFINFKTNVCPFSLSLQRNGPNDYLLRLWNGRGPETRPVRMNEWHMAVIQMNGDEFSVRNVTFEVEALSVLRTDAGRRAFSERLAARRFAGGPVLVESFQRGVANGGTLMIGGTSSEYKFADGRVIWQYSGFTGDVAWVHGFRGYLETDDLLKAEIEQTWLSRWPRKNLE